MTDAKEGLVAESVVVRYGSVLAVNGASLQVQPGQIVALLGQNGAGKSSLVKAMSGAVPTRKGRITVDGFDASTEGPTDRLGRGVCHVPEGRHLFATETVLDNLLIGGHSRRRGINLHDKVEELLEKVPLLRDHLHRRAGLLSGGQQQLVAVLRGLMSEPRYLLLDEPFGGLSPAAREDITYLIRDIAASGAGVILVEQLAAAALNIADEVSVLHDGRVTLTGTAAELGDGAAVYDAYLGTQLSHAQKDDADA